MQGAIWERQNWDGNYQHKYEHVQRSDTESSETLEETYYNTKLQPISHRRFKIVGLLLFVLAVVALGGAGWTWIRTDRGSIRWNDLRLDPHAPRRTPLSCGNSTEEAEALDCEYDVLAANWLHRDCPRNYVDEFYYFQNGTAWPYYTDQNGTHQMSLYELAHKGYYWSSTREHLVHCSFMLKRGHDVMARGDRLDGLVGSLEHANHCAQYLMENLGLPDEELDKIRTYGTIGFLLSTVTKSLFRDALNAG
ncbi:hypothetical protein GLAREA_06511 [Glarea lozoyensis ATCC 20868]|uniref:Uncharacterized protein n=1 Tax=Glarea lozoyensis (strain ATCC 20868 / MF5171) TaxID=1116229 RepID=S3E507_GLAL2|nr:uncharacterized protein GLAREA_06511 [Glarea lozoyensis ATCC 20868]EPE33498.1 hypothetical protein GLAREA_06511 [Glarea lozoyensis ATCC 20868]